MPHHAETDKDDEAADQTSIVECILVDWHWCIINTNTVTQVWLFSMQPLSLPLILCNLSRPLHLWPACSTSFILRGLPIRWPLAAAWRNGHFPWCLKYPKDCETGSRCEVTLCPVLRMQFGFPKLLLWEKPPRDVLSHFSFSYGETCVRLRSFSGGERHKYLLAR